jgi:hypothetical protein
MTQAPAEAPEPMSGLTLESDPPGARVFVDSIDQELTTPVVLRLPTGRTHTVRLEREGYQSYTGEVRLDTGVDDYHKITLKRMATSPVSGVLVVRCSQECDEIYLDGQRVSATPRAELTLGSVPFGVHTVGARRQGVLRTARVKLDSGATRQVAFNFPAAFAPAQAYAAEVPPRSAAERPAPERAALEKAPPIAVRRPTVIPETPRHAFLVVKANEPGCSVMIFQGTRLVKAGFTGDRMELPPGEYNVQVSKDGYTPVTRDVTLRGDYQIMQVDLR